MASAPASGLPIACVGVDVARGDTRILSGVDLAIARGARTFVLGANGSGKSTLLRTLHGLLPPSAGAITWGGQTGSTGAARRWCSSRRCCSAAARPRTSATR